MKKRILRIACAAALVSLAACSGEDPGQKQSQIPEGPPVEQPQTKGISILGQQFSNGTRTVLQPDGLTLHWHQNDKLGVMMSCGGETASAVYSVSGSVAGDGSAVFAGDLEWKGEAGDLHTFYAYYPVAGETAAGEPSAVTVSVPSEQYQSGASNDHLSGLTMLVAAPARKAAPEEGAEASEHIVNLSFRHVLPMLEFRLASLTGDFMITSIELQAPQGECIAVEDAILDATLAAADDGFARLSGGTPSDKVTLSVSGTPAVPVTADPFFESDYMEPAGSDVFTASMVICPADLSGKKINITVRGTEGDVEAVYTFEKDGADFVRGKKYVTTLTLVPSGIKFDTRLATASHQVATHGVMSESGYRENERSATRFLAEASGSGQADWNYWGTMRVNEPTEEWVILKLEQQQPLNQMWLLPRANDYRQFPISFRLYASVEGGTVTREGQEYDYDTKIELNGGGNQFNKRATDNYQGWGEPVLSVDGCYVSAQEYRKFEFSPVEARYVKLVITRQPMSGQLEWTSTLSEMELYLSRTPLAPQPADVKNVNIAFSGDIVEASSFQAADWISEWSQPDRKPVRMLNGVINGNLDCWSPDPSNSSGDVYDEWVVVRLSRRQQINRIVLNWHDRAPEDFTVWVSPDGQDWTGQVVTQTGFASDGSAATFDFAPVEAGYVKLNVTKLAAAAANRLYITELEAYLAE